MKRYLLIFLVGMIVFAYILLKYNETHMKPYLPPVKVVSHFIESLQQPSHLSSAQWWDTGTGRSRYFIISKEKKFAAQSQYDIRGQAIRGDEARVLVYRKYAPKNITSSINVRLYRNQGEWKIVRWDAEVPLKK